MLGRGSRLLFFKILDQFIVCHCRERTSAVEEIHEPEALDPIEPTTEHYTPDGGSFSRPLFTSLLPIGSCRPLFRDWRPSSPLGHRAPVPLIFAMSRLLPCLQSSQDALEAFARQQQRLSCLHHPFCQPR